MKGALTIAGREIRSAFATPLAYVVIAGFSLLAAFFFFSFLSNFNNQLRQTMLFASVKPSLNELVVMPYFQTLEIILIFLVPLLTMRSIAEEKRSGTFEVLITSPISGAGIVMGKFIGAAVIALVMLGISLLYPAVLIVLADPEPGPILAGFFGLVLFALSFIAVGIAVSAVSRSQTVAGVISLVVLLVFYMLDAPAPLVGGELAEVLKFLAPSSHAQTLIKGVITGSDILYFISVALCGLFAANRVLDAQRWR